MKQAIIKVFCVIGVFCIFLAVNVTAQETRKNAKANIVKKMFDGRDPQTPFVVLTPSDLSSLSNEELEALTFTGDPCNTALPINFGQTINGALASTDCQLKDGSFADFYSFSGVSGRQATINLSSAVFDTYLGLATESGTFTWEDDDGGGGTNSRIVADLPETGTYIILANSFLPNTFGAYAVSLADTTPCRFILNPTSQVVPAAGGSFSFSVTANDQSCQWAATSFDSWITTSSSGTGNGTVNYTVAASTSQNDRFASLRVNNEIFSVRQEAIFCSLSFDPPSATAPAAGGSGSFTVTTHPACSWTASGGEFTSSNSSGTGNGTVNYTVNNNNGAARTAAVFVTTQTRTTNFLIEQAGLNCTYAVSDRLIFVNPFATTGKVRVITQPGCTWSAASNSGFVPIDVTSGTGPGDISWSISANPGAGERTGFLQITGVISPAIIQGRSSFRIPFDFDGDSRTDVSIYRPGVGQWWYLRSSDNQNRAFAFGAANDKIVPADYTGDGKSDIAFWRQSTGEWFILRSEDGGFYSFPFGTDGDIPAPGDFDGDGKADPAIFRPSTGTWFILRSSDNNVEFTTFGTVGDKPVVGDYDRDGKADVAIYRPNVSQWWILNSANASLRAFQFGQPGDIPVQMDYTSDGSVDAAVFRPSTNEWLILATESGSFFGFPFGSAGDIPVPGHYDRDGKADAAIFRPSENTWYILRSNDGFAAVTFGAAGDKPVPSAFTE